MKMKEVIMKVSVGISNRHVHLNDDDYQILFKDMLLSKKVDLKQPGTFASTLTVTIKGNKNEIKNVRVLGPNRDYTQVEVSRTDTYTLGVEAPIRTSGDLKDAGLITIIGPCGEITRHACIVANRHIHVDKIIRHKYHLENVEEVQLRVGGEKGGIMNHVHLKDSDHAYFEVHLDMDDANSFMLNNNDEIEIIQ